jgi:hypothetical protein
VRRDINETAATRNKNKRNFWDKEWLGKETTGLIMCKTKLQHKIITNEQQQHNQPTEWEGQFPNEIHLGFYKDFPSAGTVGVVTRPRDGRSGVQILA